jgi:hypothetical protein
MTRFYWKFTRANVFNIAYPHRLMYLCLQSRLLPDSNLSQSGPTPPCINYKCPRKVSQADPNSRLYSTYYLLDLGARARSSDFIRIDLYHQSIFYLVLNQGPQFPLNSYMGASRNVYRVSRPRSGLDPQSST